MKQTFAEVFNIEPRHVSQDELEELSRKFWLGNQDEFDEAVKETINADLMCRLGLIIIEKPTKSRVDFRTKVKLKVRETQDEV